MKAVISRLLIFIWLVQIAIPLSIVPTQSETENHIICQGAGVGLPMLLIASLCAEVFSANKVWIGGTDTTWNTAGNWSASGVPGTTDSVVLDSQATKNCGLNSAGSVNRFTIKSNFTRTFYQLTNTLTVGAGGFSQAGGTFTGGNSTITINGDYTLTGGTITSTTGNLAVAGVWNTANSGAFTVNGGTFTHNGGTLLLNKGLQDNQLSATITIGLASKRLTLGALHFSTTSNNGSIVTYNITSGDTLTVTKTLSYDNSGTGINRINGGAIEAQDSIVCNVSGGGNTSIIVNGNKTQYYKCVSGQSVSNLILNTTDSLNPASTDFGVGDFTLTTGVFVCPTGTLYINGQANTAGTGNFTVNGGTFKHNNGIVSFYKSSIGASQTATITIGLASKRLTFYSLTFNPMANNGASQTYTITSGDTLTVTKTFRQSNQSGGGSGGVTYVNTGAIEAQDSVLIYGGANGGTASLIVNGNKTQYYSSTGGNCPPLTLNTTDSLKPASGTTVFGANGFTSTAGTFVCPTGIFTVCNMNVNTASNFTFNGGTFVHNNGTLQLYGNAVDNTNTITVTIGTASKRLTLGGLWLYSSHNCCGIENFNIASGDTLTVTKTFRQSNNSSSDYVNTGTIEAQDSVVFAVSGGGGTANFILNGTGTQYLINSGGGLIPSGSWIVNKSSGAVVLGSNITFPAKLRITSGTFNNGATYKLTTGDSLIIGAAGNYVDTGTGGLTLAGPVNNSGTVMINGNGDGCGDGDSIFIRSSLNGTRRNWAGTGAFQIIDVKIRDMSSTPAITAYSSTDSLNNTTNWTIDANCYVPSATTIRPAAAKRLAIVTMNGTNFLATQGLGEIMIGAIHLGAAQSWSTTAIVDTVPTAATFGTNNAIIINNSLGKDTVIFRVTNPGITIP